MAYDATNPPRLVRQAGVDAASGIIWGQQWIFEGTDDITVIAQRAGYFSNGQQLRMQPGDEILIMNLSNGREWRSTINSVGPAGATIDAGYTLVNIGVLSATEAGMVNMPFSTPVNYTSMKVQFTPGAWPTISASGTFGAGGSVSLQGSNDGATWVALSPPALTAAGTFKALQASEVYIFCQAVVTGGDGTTSISLSYPV